MRSKHSNIPTPPANDSTQLSSTEEGRGLSYVDCAKKILEEFSSNKPMHYKDITKIALDKGWLVTRGLTPEASMYACVLTENKRQKTLGQLEPFVQHGRGFISLSPSPKNDDGVMSKIFQHNDKIREALYKQLMAMKPSEFEEIVAVLLTSIGFENVEVTQATRDQGIDVRGILVVGNVIRIKMAVQVKRWDRKSNKIQPSVIQQVRGSLGAHEQGLIITTGDFTPAAEVEARQTDKAPIALMDGKAVVQLLMQHGIKVKCTSIDVFDIDDEEDERPLE